MLTRLISVLIALPIALFLFHTGGWGFGGLILLAGGISFYEFFGISLPGDRLSRGVLTTLGLFWLLILQMGTLSGGRGLLGVALFTAAIVLWFLFRPGEIDTTASRLGQALLGFFWVASLLGSVAMLRLFDGTEGWLLLACVLAWGSDTGAYFAGRAFGNRKLYPLISPNKTWAGAIGGVVSASLLAFGLRAWWPLSISSVDLLWVAVLGTAMGQLGDLAESLVKRSAGVKDSGSIMPGHGGMLDRIDALMFVGPVVLTYLVVVAEKQPHWLTLF